MAVAKALSGTLKVTQPERHFPAGTVPPSSSGFLAPAPRSCIVPSSSMSRK